MRQTPESTDREIENDHRQLLEIFSAADFSACNCPVPGTCDTQACEHGSRCSAGVRERFHSVMFACIARFAREEKQLKESLPRMRFQQHTEHHASITDRIVKAIAVFTQSRDVKLAYAAIESIARTYAVHHQVMDRINSSAFDMEMPDISPERLLAWEMLPPPSTGNPKIDEEHLRLHHLLLEASDLCANRSSSCCVCQAERRQCCLTKAINLIGETLKYMVDHFRHEESLIRLQTDYARMAAHQSAHAEISLWLGQLIDDYRDEDTARCMQTLIQILHHWLHRHIVDYDLPFFAVGSGANPDRFPVATPTA